ncbi:C-terminal binding protein [Pontibacter sp. G13]|uniref:C-terminal binding protein n=1 Tax=Pontibacter sp. G13 TaxID=3074898 RepID=UPI00288AC848|nr:C-terminal binding protein [Pontibacter sp. G13]WNJ18445.1 C-terminal binding protein [Pontibacter sp. G13]
MKVAITDCTFPHFQEEQIMCERAGHELEIHQCQAPEEVIRLCADADALLNQYVILNEQVLSSLTRCRIIVRYGIGVDNIDLAAAARLGITVCNVPDYGIGEVADHASALILSLVRQLPYFDREVRLGNWPAKSPLQVQSCSDMTFVAIGFGRIGRATLKRMQAFGFTCKAYDPFVTAEQMYELDVQKVDLDTAFSEGDAISLHLPHTPETHHLVNTHRLHQMKSSAILVNTSRGQLIDTHALASALKHEQIGLAGIDVFEREPMEREHPLRQCERAILTPHIAYHSLSSLKRLQQYAAEEVERALREEPVRCRVV